MKKKDLYEKYLKEGWWRKISLPTFYAYLAELETYDKVVSFLNKPKNNINSKGGKFKRKNPSEIIDFAKLFSIEKAAKEYNISERTIYRYINNKKNAK